MAYVLIVDDDEDFGLAASTVLTEAGHEVAVELDTQEGLASIRRRRPDLAILDVMFPEDPSAGFHLARTLHEDEKLRTLPVLMLTAVNAKFPLGFGSGDIDDEWMPVSDFLEKPVDLDQLQRKVSEMVRPAASGGES